MATNNNSRKHGELKKMQSHLLQWSRDDEIIVLDQLFQFSGKYGYYMREFYELVKKMLSIEVSENQLAYMIYCLRKEYSEKRREDDDNLDSHALKVLELSNKIWGSPEEDVKTKALRDYYERSLEEYVERKVGFTVDCLTSSVMEEIKKEWEDFKFVENELHMMEHRLHLQICEFKSNMRKSRTGSVGDSLKS